jgi:hypothetical protein
MVMGKDTWSYKDIPIGDYSVVTEPNLVTGEIKQITTIAGRISEEIVQTKADQLRNALIDLGWTPPEGKEHIPESRLPAGFRDEWLPKAAECSLYGVFLKDLPLADLLSAAAFSFSRYFKSQQRLR